MTKKIIGDWRWQQKDNELEYRKGAL
jgi:hypothetical protein